jgi:hypothetical protein
MPQDTPSAHDAHDLTASFPQNLQDGEHHLHTTSEGLDLSANVKGGKVTWRATDHGNELEVKTYLGPPCMCCVETRYGRRCFIVPCPWITAN